MSSMGRYWRCQLVCEAGVEFKWMVYRVIGDFSSDGWECCCFGGELDFIFSASSLNSRHHVKHRLNNSLDENVPSTWTTLLAILIF